MLLICSFWWVQEEFTVLCIAYISTVYKSIKVFVIAPCSYVSQGGPWSDISNTCQTSQIWHAWDQTGAGPENFSNHKWSTYYNTKTQMSHRKQNVLVLLHNGDLALVAGSGCLNLSDLIIHSLLNTENKSVCNIFCNLNFLCQMLVIFNIELTWSGTQGC